MKIKIKRNSKKWSLVFWVPFGIIASRLSCKIMQKNSHTTVSSADLHKFLKYCKKELKQYKKLTVLEVKSSDGYNITITV